MLNNKNAFTMIELVFVIVILGILSAIAIPKFAATRTDAQISKGRADISSIRSAIISERQSRLIKGDPLFISSGLNAEELDNGGYFGGVLTYPVTAKDSSGHWHSRASLDANTTTYEYTVSKTDIIFTYTRGDGVFTCSKTAGSAKENLYCANLID